MRLESEQATSCEKLVHLLRVVAQEVHSWEEEVMPMRAVEYRAHHPAPSPGSRRFLTIGELESLYGRDATVEVDAEAPPAFPPVIEQPPVAPPIIERPYVEPPLPQRNLPRDPGFYQPYYDEPEEESVLPRRRSPFVPFTVAIVVGAAALLGYGLYLRGYLDVPALLSRGAELGPTGELEVGRSLEVTSFPVAIKAPSPAQEPKPAADETTAAEESDLSAAPSEQTLPSLVEPKEPSLPRAIAPPKPSARARATTPARAPAPAARVAPRRDTSVEDAATMEVIRRDAARAKEDRASRERRIEQSITSDKQENAYPPGYIEADEPAD